MSERLRRRIERDFAPGSSDEVVRTLVELDPRVVGGQSTERVLTAVVLSSNGQWWRFEDAIATLRMDWRDALVNGGLADEDWPFRLEAALSD